MLFRLGKMGVRQGLADAEVFMPSVIANLALWLDSSDASTVTETSGAVSQWDDKSGNANNAVQGAGASHPTTGMRTINGLNAIDFMLLNSALYTVPMEANTIFVLYASDKLIRVKSLLDGTTTGTRWGLLTSGNINNCLNNTSFTPAGITFTSDTNPYINWLKRDGVTLTSGYDALTASAAAADVTVTEINLGRYALDASNFMYGVITEILVYSCALTTSEHNQVELFSK